MEAYKLDNVNIIINREGSREFSKVSYPIRYGRFSEIETPDYLFQFNLNGEIKYIQGRRPTWPHPSEWLKRSVADDWVYYSTGGYAGVFDCLGEYYLPCFPYPSNSINNSNPFADHNVCSGIEAWQRLSKRIKILAPLSIPWSVKDLLLSVAKKDPEALRLRAHKFHDLIGGPVTVLPPDTRHVDYEVIPLILADGCLYNCEFCRVKSGQYFRPRTKKDVIDQIRGLREFYSKDLENYNSVFLGQHDALSVGRELIEFAAKNAYEMFEFGRSNMRGANLFLFGSAHSILSSNDSLFESLSRLPFSTYINIGLESADQTTLSVLKKPISANMVDRAFAKMIDINRRYEKIEVTANFVFGDDLPPGHLSSFFEMTYDKLKRFYSKGAVYFSPLMNGRERKLKVNTKSGILRKFYEVKSRSRIPAYIYIIQRL